ncbi:MAG: hypothetical protein E6K63_03425 [Nitrospirae bacterium]|nr:MAG: hypothetical protein E6K63_03425 [Nitrospirota bacterium]
MVSTAQEERRLNPRYLGRAFSIATEQAGIQPFRLHDLRHIFATPGQCREASIRTRSNGVSGIQHG